MLESKFINMCTVKMSRVRCGEIDIKYRFGYNAIIVGTVTILEQDVVLAMKQMVQCWPISDTIVTLKYLLHGYMAAFHYSSRYVWCSFFDW